MAYLVIDGQVIKKMFSSSAIYFERNVEFINSLNVFPVPDGDTGTNMNLTIRAAVDALASEEDKHLGKIMKKLSRGMLLGARGNSGVILSQIWRGMSQVLEDKKEMTTQDFAEALQRGSDVAYHSVMKPVEGTILTVIRETAQDAQALAIIEKDFVVFLEQVICAATASLKRTPDLLPILKEVGAVDSGGQGLVTLFEGMLMQLTGVSTDVQIKKAVKLDLKSFDFDDIHGEDELGFCTEFIIRLGDIKSFDEDTMRTSLSAAGESLVLVHDDEIVKVHIHTEQPLEIFKEYANLGEFLWIKAENMQEQFHEQQDKNKTIAPVNKQKIATAIIAVASGAGIVATFKDLGVHCVVDGGQTSNPSTQDLLDAVESVDAESYIILPNNGNIILAAEQVKSLTDKIVEIVPSTTIPQGLTAVIAFNSLATLTNNVKQMDDALSNVKSGEVTTAVRNTVLNGTNITEGSFLSITGKEIVASEPTLLESLKKLLDKMIDSEAEIITLIEGVNVDMQDKDLLLAYIEHTYPDLEVEYIYGKQEVYFYLVSVE
ncbi:phosphatase [Erysipelotrichaceae bacterium]|nr:phosphatase [Erysipelotrichaceae bacterium]